MQSAALLSRSTAFFSEAQAFPPKIGCAIDGRDSSCAADPNMLQIYKLVSLLKKRQRGQ
ncbi:hypothetical protein GGE24_005517 [Bradyrhizobium centrosematis]|nr:hypothetical protein [Bradyrhizobium centrosematis]MCS3776161.1 hypothetical protein [Bradyrhizobium centrosematis]